jgi:curli biogenesis system outer membrane secretion channel CsgG
MRVLVRAFTLVAATGLLIAPATKTVTAQAKAARPAVALLDFDYASINHWWGGNEDVGKGVADLIVEGLVEDGSFRVYERKKLAAVLGEQDFSNSDRAEPSAKQVAKIGKMAGVKYLITGSITKFGTEESSKGINAGAFGGSKFGVGKIGKAEGKANVAITARLVDSSTGEILAIAKGEATSKRSGMLLGGGGGGGGKGGGAELSMTASDFKDTILGEALQAAVTQVVTKLIAAKSRLE